MLFGCGQRADRQCQDGHAALPPIHEDATAARRGNDAPNAPVPRVGDDANEAVTLELADESADGRWTNLFGRREVTERDGTAEDDDGEGGELWRGEAGGGIFGAEAPEEVDRRRVELVGGAFGGGLTAARHEVIV